MTDSRVADAACVVIERIGAQCSVLGAACKAKERIGIFGGVVAGIASVRWWINRSSRRRKREKGWRTPAPGRYTAAAAANSTTILTLSFNKQAQFPPCAEGPVAPA